MVSWMWEKNKKHLNKNFGSVLYAKIYRVIPCVFFQMWLKNCKLGKIQKHHVERFSKTHKVMFSAFLLPCFFYHFWKNTQGIVISTMYILVYKPPSATNREQKITFDHLFLCGETCCLGKKMIYILSKNIINS